MCVFKSGLILKDRVFIPDYDLHSDMLEELKIEDTKANAERLFVRAELSPKDGDIFSPVETWEFTVDQDILPDWFVKEVDKKRMVTAVKEWTKTHIFVGVDNFRIKNSKGYYLKNCKNITCDNSIVFAFGNSTITAMGNSTIIAFGKSTVFARENSIVTAWDNSTITACGKSTITAMGNSTITAWDDSTITAWDNSTITAMGNSTITAMGNSTVVKNEFSLFSKEHLVLSGNATFKDCSAKIIYQSGDWELRKV